MQFQAALPNQGAGIAPRTPTLDGYTVDVSEIDGKLGAAVTTGAVLNGNDAVAACVRLGHPHAFASPSAAKDYFKVVSLDGAFHIRVKSGGGAIFPVLAEIDKTKGTAYVASFPDAYDGHLGNNGKTVTIFCKACRDVTPKEKPSSDDAKGYSITLAYCAERLYPYLEEKFRVQEAQTDGPNQLEALLPCVVSKIHLQHLQHEFNYEDQHYLAQLTVSFPRSSITFTAKNVGCVCSDTTVTCPTSPW